MKFHTQLTAKEIFKFSLIYSYTGVSGIMAVFMMIMGVLMCYRGIALNAGATYIVFGLVIIALFVAINPIMLYTKAKNQAATNNNYKQPTYYTLTDDGIKVEIGEDSGVIEWWRIQKVRHILGLYIFYTGRQQAFVFPEEDLGEQKQQIIDYITEHVKNSEKKPRRQRQQVVSASMKKYTKPEEGNQQESASKAESDDKQDE